MLRAAIVGGQRIQRLREPPPPSLEGCSVSAVQRPVALCRLALEESGNVVPVTPLLVWHLGQGCGERAVRARVVSSHVPHQARQCVTPPSHGPTLRRDAGRLLGLAVLHQVAHLLAGDPFVSRERGARLLECCEEAGARRTNPRRLRENAFLVSIALEPQADAPDNLAAPACGTAGK